MKNLRDEALCYLLVQGHDANEIAQALTMKEEHVRLKLSDKSIIKECDALRNKLFTKDSKETLKEMLPDSLEVLKNTLKDPGAKLQIKFAAAQEVLDRVMGKPKQTVEHEGSVIRALYERLDKQSKEKQVSQVIDAEVVQVIVDNPNLLPPKQKENPNLSYDSVDKWVSNNL